MQDEEIALLNACTDLVSMKKYEAFPRALLGDKRAGEWTNVKTLCEQVGLPAGEFATSLFAGWLADPRNNDAYAVILFYDDESQWTTASHTNRQYLLGGNDGTHLLRRQRSSSH